MQARLLVRYGGLILLVSVCASSCRQLNPGFYIGPGSTSTALTPEEDPQRETQDTAQSTVTTKGELATTSTPSQTPATSTTQDEAQLTTTLASKSSDASNNASTTMSSSLSSSTSSSTGIVHWTPDTPAPAMNAGDEDLCLRGSKACYVFADHSASQLESVTPGYPGMFLSITGALAPASNHPSSKAPLNKGLRIDGANTHLESTGPYPRFIGQDFGIEIWYRSDAKPNYPKPADPNKEKPALLVQVLSNIWLDETPSDGGVSCGAWSTQSPWHRVQHQYKVGPDQTPPRPRDQLRVAACVIAHGKLHVFSNGVLNVEFKDPMQGEFRVHKNTVDQKIAIGGWVTGDGADKDFQTFRGTVYMVRLWNNVEYMKDAMIRDLNYHGLSSYVPGIDAIPD